MTPTAHTADEAEPRVFDSWINLPYAPGVEWYYWPSGAVSSQPAGDKYGGGQTVTVSAPLGKLPLFVRSGAIIPMSASMQYANQTQPGWMDIFCWPSGSSELCPVAAP